MVKSQANKGLHRNWYNRNYKVRLARLLTVTVSSYNLTTVKTSIDIIK